MSRARIALWSRDCCVREFIGVPRWRVEADTPESHIKQWGRHECRCPEGVPINLYHRPRLTSIVAQ